MARICRAGLLDRRGADNETARERLVLSRAIGTGQLVSASWRGTPGTPLEQYTIDDIKREFLTPKWCAPYCTVGCVHRVSTMDFWRSPQEAAAGSPQSPVSSHQS